MSSSRPDRAVVLAICSATFGVAGAGATTPARFPLEFRTIDGSGNNPLESARGSAGIPLERRTAVDYADGIDAPAGVGRASARAISNEVAAQTASRPSSLGATDFVWQWGQFLDHDIDLTAGAVPLEPFDIPVPPGDPQFDPSHTGGGVIPLARSAHDSSSGVREQINAITAFIDASNVYGSNPARAAALRTNDGTGRLRSGPDGLLPYNDAGLANAPDDLDPTFYLAGDVRANEQVALTALHALFVREHNFWADRFGRSTEPLSGDELYERARALVGAEIQAITYREFLPTLLGPGALRPYAGYDPTVNPGIANVFSTAAYRFGHSMLSDRLARLDHRRRPIAAGPILLRDAFFNPQSVADHGIEPLLRGLAVQTAQEIDTLLVDSVRNFLFGPPGASGFDLASLNIQRGRDHGLPTYNAVRAAYGLAPRASFSAVSPDPAVRAALERAYGTVEEVEAWVGGLAEEHVPGGLVGPTVRVVLADQFERLRDGDRFWYQAYLPPSLITAVEGQSLATIIRRNTAIGRELPDDVFRGPRPGGR